MEQNYKIAAGDSVLGALTQLTTDVSDAVSGYKEMVERAEDELRPIVQRLHDMHETHASQLMSHLVDLGGDPNRAGSAMSTVHTAIAVVRDWVGALDKSALDEIKSGEQNLIESYDTAAAEIGEHADLRATLDQHRADIRDMINDI